jgi:hypothetical protein
MCFVDSRHVTRESSELLRCCGVDSVLIGVESGSERILRRNGKATTRRAIMSAVEALVDAGIRVSCSFVFGLLDEDDESIEETIDLAGTLRSMDGVVCYGNVIIPLMGSRLWEQVFATERTWPSFVTSPVDYDLERVRELYVTLGTRVSRGVEGLRVACRRMLESSRLAVMEYAR